MASKIDNVVLSEFVLGTTITPTILTRTTWTRGAVEFSTGVDTTPPAAPTGVTISQLPAPTNLHFVGAP